MKRKTRNRKPASKKAAKPSRIRCTDGLCAVCLGTGKYQREHNQPSHWHLEKFSESHYSIIGRLKTMNDGESREEVMGVAEYREAVRIRDNHNGEMDELIRLIGINDKDSISEWFDRAG